MSFQFPKASESGPPSIVDRRVSTDVYDSTDRLAVQETTANEPQSRTSPEPTQTDQQGHYIGPASGASFLLRIQKTLHKNSSVSHDSSIFTFGDAPLPNCDPTFFILPSKTTGQQLVERYFDFAAPTHRFLHRPSIENILDEFYRTQGEMLNKEDAPAKSALLFIVFAQAQAYAPPDDPLQDNGARYYYAAEHQLSKERGAVRLASVQARLGQCFYLLTQSRINHAWSLFGTLAHLAFAIGLNRGRRTDSSAKVDYVELECRRRLFWCAYTLDKYLAAALGRPRTFKDEDIDQELPTVVNDNDLHRNSISPAPPRAQSLMRAPVEHFKLSKIVSLILRDLYAIHPPSTAFRIELSAKYSKDLREWRANLTPFFVSESIDSNLVIPLYSRQRRVLNLAYYHAVLLIQRPFLLSNFAALSHSTTNPPQPLSVETSQNIRECLDAAMGIVNIIDEMSSSSQFFRAFWFTQYYAFCAVVVLYIYRIQQHLVEPGKCEGFFTAGQRCQAQLNAISESDTLSQRYCLVLEELRIEAARRTSSSSRPAAPTNGNITDSPSLATATRLDDPTIPQAQSALNVTSSTPQSDTEAPFPGNFYNGMPTPESAIFSNNFLPNSSIMADLTSWGSFDSLVTAGIGSGMLDNGTGWQGDVFGGLGFGLGR
ncbi:hypothetical protein BU24DRAFT_465587 [Aaosphaeria arxii CBS 175.79]|uniref:Xylanolytic transcriptional activator regulatory domain-containing protein n=1 Tax=Aaosphaeria arxii CBS 175.79 TaxID=1450172 RepID=A0A6A5XFJ6_9PLEO|nr:uncharacterized protein BU24DRAFT_465587 [Aaosphaeria arxii CBS 175.79]KAF2012015.1 hypothetical protein BU24DRAFT_465587 [Aaosphaeria arxii CBS 175.79]